MVEDGFGKHSWCGIEDGFGKQWLLWVKDRETVWVRETVLGCGLKCCLWVIVSGAFLGLFQAQ